MPPYNPFSPGPTTNGPTPAVPTPAQPAAPTYSAAPAAPAQAIPQAAPQPAPQAVGSQPTANTKPTPKNPNSTQSALQLSEIRDGMVIMIDGSFRAVVACQSINFDLMSDRERDGIEFSYQNFLNSLNFPIQILVRSKRVDIGPYIDKLIELRRNQDNMLLGILMDDYVNFIDVLAQEANIMEKTFYIVVPYFPQGDAANLLEQGKGFFGKLFARPKNTITRINADDYQKAKDEIKNRTDTVMAGLYQMGVQSMQLDTKSLGELFYSAYNPDTALRQPVTDFDNLASIYVRKGTGPAPTPSGGAQ